MRSSSFAQNQGAQNDEVQVSFVVRLESLQVLEFEANNRDDIQAACTGIGGRPTPTFHWFVDDSNNREIDESELNARDNEWDDNGVPMIEQTIRSVVGRRLDVYEIDQRFSTE